MSTASDITVQSLTTLLSSAAGPSAAVTSVANLLSQLLKIGEPLITDDIAHRYDQQVKDRLTELVSIFAQADGDDRADKLNRYFTQLCIDAGTPAIGLGADISVPVAFILSLAAGNLKAIRDEALLTTLTQTATKGAPAAQAK